jgi:peptide/nickel transport system permease protein
VGLKEYIITRIILTLPMVFILLSIVFIVMRILPGNPVLLRFEKNADPQLIASYTHKLSLDKPLYIQYIDYINNLFHGNLGLSMSGDFEPVAPEIMSRFPATLELAIYSTIVAIISGIGLGLLGASKGGKIDSSVKVYGIGILCNTCVLHRYDITDNFWCFPSCSSCLRKV